SGKLEVQKSFHLPRERDAVTVPPYFFHSWCEVYVQIFQPDHFFEAKASMGAADTARLYSAMRSLADAETRNHIVDHDSARLNAPRQALTALPAASPHARREAKFRVVGETHRFLV